MPSGLELETDFFVTGGWSGGPLWGWMSVGSHVVGITSGWEVDGWDPVRSVIAGGAHLVELTQFGWDNWQSAYAKLSRVIPTQHWHITTRPALREGPATSRTCREMAMA